MEYKKSDKGFILEFNEAEEMNFENFVDILKKHSEFSSLSSKDEFLALIITEGVASLQHKIDTVKEEPDELEDFFLPGPLTELLESLVNDSLSALQHAFTKENGFPSHNEQVIIIPDFNSRNLKTDQSIQKDEYLLELDDSLPSRLNHDTDSSSKNTD